MKLTTTTRKHVLPNNGVSYVDGLAKSAKIDRAYWGLMYVIAEMLDEIAQGGQFYMTIGSTMKADAYTLTINQAGDKTTIYADDLHDLVLKAGELSDALSAT